jgi:cellulose synthase/poly-beta-1,6-N-acetylglucosamine synthase-like glycosyltransferase
MLISVIVTTYNWKQALAACLNSLFLQTDLGFEIIVADDGSRPDTSALIAEFISRSPVVLKHCYQEDDGFAPEKSVTAPHCSVPAIIYCLSTVIVCCCRILFSVTAVWLKTAILLPAIGFY